MASLWRILALSWLGGVASPIMMDDSAFADALARPVAAAIEPAGTVQGMEAPSLDASSDDEAGGLAEGRE